MRHPSKEAQFHLLYQHLILPLTKVDGDWPVNQQLCFHGQLSFHNNRPVWHPCTVETAINIQSTWWDIYVWGQESFSEFHIEGSALMDGWFPGSVRCLRTTWIQTECRWQLHHQGLTGRRQTRGQSHHSLVWVTPVCTYHSPLKLIIWQLRLCDADNLYRSPKHSWFLHVNKNKVTRDQ